MNRNSKQILDNAKNQLYSKKLKIRFDDIPNSSMYPYVRYFEELFSGKKLETRYIQLVRAAKECNNKFDQSVRNDFYNFLRCALFKGWFNIEHNHQVIRYLDEYLNRDVSSIVLAYLVLFDDYLIL